MFASTRLDPVAQAQQRLQEQAAAAFDVCHPALAFRALLMVQLVLALWALAGANSMDHWGQRQGAAAFGGVLATGLWLLVVCALRSPLARLPTTARALVVLALGALASLAAWLPLAWLGVTMADGVAARFSMAGAALAGSGLAAGLWAWLELRARVWQPAHSAARLAELQSRIRPHFLFNALNTAVALVRVDAARAEAVLEDLAELFRVALAEVGTSVPWAEEVELARRYLAIEQLRFGPRLVVHWELDIEAEATLVPPLMLQPLVENAVRHGIEPAQHGGWLRVQAQRRLGQVNITVSNSLPAQTQGGEAHGAGAQGDGALGDEAQPLNASRAGHGIALNNLRERLHLLHDIGAQFKAGPELDQGQTVFCVRITLPAQ